MNDSNPVPAPNMYDNRLEITSPGKLPMGQTIERMKEGYSKIRNEALAHAFAYMNLIEHWGSGIPRIIDKVKAAGLREPEFIGGEVDLRINIYRGQVDSTVGLNAPNTAVKPPIKCRIVPMECRIKQKKCRIVLMECRIRQKKCQIMNKNSKFISMYRKMLALQRHRR